MNVKNKLIPIILFVMTICIGAYYYMVFPTIITLSEELSPGLYGADYHLPVHLIYVFIGFFFIFIALGFLQNKFYNLVRPKNFTIISGPTEKKA